MRICADTNVLVSAVATRGLCADLLRLVIRRHQLVLGEAVLGEFSRVLRGKFKLPDSAIKQHDAYFRSHAEIFAGGPRVDLELRDATDLPVVAEALAGGADVLVTGDADLLTVAAKSPVRILSPRDCWQLLRA